jgi:hypothetical protein
VSELPSSSPFASIFDEDDALGLLAQKPAAPKRSSEDEIGVGQFEAINAFIDANGVEPGSTKDGREPGLSEIGLEGSLETFRRDERYARLLGPYDRHGLLGPAVTPAPLPTNMDDILASKDALLGGPADAIFNLEHLSEAARNKAAAPDEIARRRPCPDFQRFAPIFAEIKGDLAVKRRYTKRFESEGSIKPGAAFVLNGIIAYISAVGELEKRGKEHDARIRVIFDNGTESNHLLRSFARVLYEDPEGRQIIDAEPTVSGPLFGGAGHVSGPLFTGEPETTEFGEVQGTVYVIESLSTDPQLVALKGRLYKIGFTTQDVNKRLADVEKDPTFLCAQVHLRATYTVNFNPQQLEKLLHQFFGGVNLNVEVALGKTIQPKEWFVVSLEVIEEAVNRIIDRSIVKFRYDHVNRQVVPR